MRTDVRALRLVGERPEPDTVPGRPFEGPDGLPVSCFRALWIATWMAVGALGLEPEGIPPLARPERFLRLLETRSLTSVPRDDAGRRGAPTVFPWREAFANVEAMLREGWLDRAHTLVIGAQARRCLGAALYDDERIRAHAVVRLDGAFRGHRVHDATLYFIRYPDYRVHEGEAPDEEWMDYVQSPELRGVLSAWLRNVLLPPGSLPDPWRL